MSEYRSVTHTIVELLARKKIKAVPRDTDKKRTELRNVARPDDDRKGDVPTRQGEIQKKIIDEDWASEQDKKAGKFKKGDRVLHIGGWPGKVAGPQHEWKPPKGTITGTHDHKGELVHSIKVDGKEHEQWGYPRDFKKIHEQAGLQSIATEPAKGPGPDKTRKAKKLEIQDVGKQKPTQVEINPELDNTPNIFASKEEDGKLVEAGNQYNNVSIQYQTRGGIWVTARKTSNDPADIMLAMRNVQKVYSQNRVRAIGGRGMVLDFQPIDPQNIATEETKKEKFVENPKGQINKQNTGWKSRMAWIKDDKGMSDWWKSGHDAYHNAKNKKPLPEETLDELSKPTLGRYINQSKKDLSQRTHAIGWMQAKGMQGSKDDKAQKKAAGNRERGIHQAVERLTREENLDELSKETIKGFWKGKLSVKQLNKRAKRDREEELDKKEQKVDEGNLGAAMGKSVTSTGASSGISAAMAGLKKTYPKAAEAIDKIQSGYADFTKFSPGYAAFATQKDMIPSKIVTDYIAKNKEKLAKEENLTELSKKTMSDYIPAAAGDQAAKFGEMKITRHDIPKFKKLTNAFINRKRGIKTASEKLAKEGTQVSPGVQTIEKALRKVLDESTKTPTHFFRKQRKGQGIDICRMDNGKCERKTSIDGKRRVAAEFRSKGLKIKDYDIKEARHSGIETDEPKFSQSIQKVAAHAKIYTDVSHTYKHKDGSKTKVDQELGKKIHDTIHSTPHRHRADLIQKMHSSADSLKQALKEGKSNPAPFDLVGYLTRGKGGIADRLHRSGEAKALENPVFRKRVVKDKTAYTRKEKHKGKENDQV